MRARYLVPFALRYGFGPAVVDAMRLADFAVYADGIDALAQEA